MTARYPLTFAILILAHLVLSLFAAERLVMAQVPCQDPGKLVRTNGATWASGATVTVIINPSDFPTAQEQQALQQAFTIWQSANTSSGVSFTFTTGTDPNGAINTFYINRGTTQTGGSSAISFTGSPSTEGNVTQSVRTTIDSTISRLETLTNVMDHEIGHSFGLDDCIGCPQGSTIMSDYRTDCFCPQFACDQNAPFNGMRWGCPPLDAPTECDVNGVRDRRYAPSPTPTPTPSSCPTCPFADWGDCPSNCIASVDTCQYGPRGCPPMSGIEASYCWCYRPSPILIDVSGNGFNLTGGPDGVNFDLIGDGVLKRRSWTRANSDDAWLAFDRNGNGLIDNGTELFGTATPQPAPPPGIEKHGFLALAQYDLPENGGNGDGVINNLDAIFISLRLWQDVNHNGVSESSELKTLVQLGLKTLSLDHKTSKKVDQFGNEFRYRAKVKDINGAQVGRWAWDVFLVTDQ